MALRHHEVTSCTLSHLPPFDNQLHGGTSARLFPILLRRQPAPASPGHRHRAADNASRPDESAPQKAIGVLERTRQRRHFPHRGVPGRAGRAVAPNGWFLGITSLLTDLSSEMVTSVLPMYLVLHLNLSPLAFGALDGLYNGLTAVTLWASGVVADRWRRYKSVAGIGYAISAVCRLGLLAAGASSFGVASPLCGIGGKGSTVPRDAMISLSVPPSRLAQSFGVHRALDATGAMLGPVLAFALLALVPRGFDVVFVTSFCLGVVGLGVLVLFVDVSAHRAPADATTPSLRSALGLLRHHDFRAVTMAAAGLALVTVSDPFIYLVLQERVRVNPGVFPLLYMGTSLSYLLLAIPAGVLADRIGRPRVFLIGHGSPWLYARSLQQARRRQRSGPSSSRAYSAPPWRRRAMGV